MSSSDASWWCGCCLFSLILVAVLLSLCAITEGSFRFGTALTAAADFKCPSLALIIRNILRHFACVWQTDSKRAAQKAKIHFNRRTQKNQSTEKIVLKTSHILNGYHPIETRDVVWQFSVCFCTEPIDGK